MVSQAVKSHEGHDGTMPWLGFASGLWTREINLRDFIQQNVTPYYGDDTFLAGRTKPAMAGVGALANFGNVLGALKHFEEPELGPHACVNQVPPSNKGVQ